MPRVKGETIDSYSKRQAQMSRDHTAPITESAKGVLHQVVGILSAFNANFTTPNLLLVVLLI